jgi:nicotinamide-nucleotide amidase
MKSAAVRLKNALTRRRENLCVAESLTAGHLQAAIASVSGSSEYFAGGVTVYNIDQKVALLGVDRKHAEEVNCVSSLVAEQMAAGVRRMFSASIGVATTGYAEPSAADEVPEPFAYFAIDADGRETTGRIDGRGLSRVAMQRHVARCVLEALVDLLEKAT